MAQAFFKVSMPESDCRKIILRILDIRATGIDVFLTQAVQNGCRTAGLNRVYMSRLSFSTPFSTAPTSFSL